MIQIRAGPIRPCQSQSHEKRKENASILRITQVMRGRQKRTGKEGVLALTSTTEEGEGGRGQMRIVNVLVVQSTDQEVAPEIDIGILK